MDRDKDKQYRGVNGLSNDDEIHETSFNTRESGSPEPVRSSRTMPVPEHLRCRGPQGDTDGVDDDTTPPPAYHEYVDGTGPSAGEEAGIEWADGEGDALNPAEIAVIIRSRKDLHKSLDDDGSVSEEDVKPESKDSMYQQRQADRNSYLPSSTRRRHSMEEAVEMISPEERSDLTSADRVDEVDHRRMEPMDIEEGRQSEREEYTCSGWGALDKPMTRLCRYTRRQSMQRLVLFTVLIIAVIALLLFVSLFPASFVYVDYHEIALKQSKMSNVVDRDTVYYPGCYLLGPDTTLIFFTGSVHNIVEEMSVFTLDTIGVTIRYSLHYFIRPAEVGKLFSLFMFDYDDIFKMIIKSSMRNLAGTSLTINNFRFNRTYVETQMHTMLRKRLGGDCCPECCKTQLCQSNTYCSMCKTGVCDQGYHVDVRFFNLLSVSIPDEVYERLLFKTILEVRTEKEFFLQDHAVTVKITERLTKNISNNANEVIQGANFERDKINTIAEADKEKVVQKSYAASLQGLFSTLNVTQEDHKLSLMMIRALEESSSNLYIGFGFEKNILYAP